MPQREERPVLKGQATFVQDKYGRPYAERLGEEDMNFLPVSAFEPSPAKPYDGTGVPWWSKETGQPANFGFFAPEAIEELEPGVEIFLHRVVRGEELDSAGLEPGICRYQGAVVVLGGTEVKDNDLVLLGASLDPKHPSWRFVSAFTLEPFRVAELKRQEIQILQETKDWEKAGSRFFGMVRRMLVRKSYARRASTGQGAALLARYRQASASASVEAPTAQGKAEHSAATPPAPTVTVEPVLTPEELEAGRKGTEAWDGVLLLAGQAGPQCKSKAAKLWRTLGDFRKVDPNARKTAEVFGTTLGGEAIVRARLALEDAQRQAGVTTFVKAKAGSVGGTIPPLVAAQEKSLGETVAGVSRETVMAAAMRKAIKESDSSVAAVAEIVASPVVDDQDVEIPNERRPLYEKWLTFLDGFYKGEAVGVLTPNRQQAIARKLAEQDHDPETSGHGPFEIAFQQSVPMELAGRRATKRLVSNALRQRKAVMPPGPTPVALPVEPTSEVSEAPEEDLEIRVAEEPPSESTAQDIDGDIEAGDQPTEAGPAAQVEEASELLDSGSQTFVSYARVLADCNAGSITKRQTIAGWLTSNWGDPAAVELGDRNARVKELRSQTLGQTAAETVYETILAFQKPSLENLEFNTTALTAAVEAEPVTAIAKPEERLLDLEIRFQAALEQIGANEPIAKAKGLAEHIGEPENLNTANWSKVTPLLGKAGLSKKEQEAIRPLLERGEI